MAAVVMERDAVTAAVSSLTEQAVRGRGGALFVVGARRGWARQRSWTTRLPRPGAGSRWGPAGPMSRRRPFRSA